MQDARGRFIGGTMSNLFLVRGSRLLTPRLDTCGVAGTVRGLALRIAGDLGIEVPESDIAVSDIAAADGLFLTNSLIGVWPVRRLGTEILSLKSLPAELIEAIRRAAGKPDGGWGG